MHKLYPEIPLSTIKTTLQAESRRQNHVSCPRPGARRKLTQADRDLIANMIRISPNIKNKELLEAVNNKIKLRSLQHLLWELNISRNIS